MTRRLRGDDRAVSVAITHVLTIGITAVLISGLMVGASTMLDTERERGAERSMETVGERLAGEIASVDRLGEDGDEITLAVEHPRRVGGSTYSIEAVPDGPDEQCPSSLVDDDTACLVLTAHGESASVVVPLTVSDGVEIGGAASGGPIVIAYDGSPDTDEITIESGRP